MTQDYAVDVTNGARLTTYVIPDKPASSTVCVNGAAAHLMEPGDVVIVIGYALLEDTEARTRRPPVVFVDTRNRIVDEGDDAADVPADFGPRPSGARLVDLAGRRGQ